MIRTDSSYSATSYQVHPNDLTGVLLLTSLKEQHARLPHSYANFSSFAYISIMLSRVFMKFFFNSIFWRAEGVTKEKP
jgi:hypothetical protein